VPNLKPIARARDGHRARQLLLPAPSQVIARASGPSGRDRPEQCIQLRGVDTDKARPTPIRSEPARRHIPTDRPGVHVRNRCSIGKGDQVAMRC
jgi:hypothetical protein